MKFSFDFKENLKRLFFLGLVFILFFPPCNFQIVRVISMENNQNELVTEELRLEIPSEFKEAWLAAERNIWEPWLSKQEGYLGRQIFWDKENDQALILVNWKNKKLWKGISNKEVNLIQRKFEDNVKTSLKINTNPFKLIYEGEIYKQG